MLNIILLSTKFNPNEKIIRKLSGKRFFLSIPFDLCYIIKEVRGLKNLE